MEYRVLGSLEVLDRSGHPLPLGGVKQQTVLASLVLRAGRTVPLQRLMDELWERPPKTAAKTVQVYVSRLRHQLEGAIESRRGGYALVLDGDELDLAQFERIADEGRAALSAGDAERAARLLRNALALWRGPALSGLPSETLQREAERLEELRLQALEDRLEADFERGREREVVAELQPLVAEHPFRERFRAQLMLSLYRTGRQTDALELYRETRNLLSEEPAWSRAPSCAISSAGCSRTIPGSSLHRPSRRRRPCRSLRHGHRNLSAAGVRRPSSSQTWSIRRPWASSSIPNRCTGSWSATRRSRGRLSSATGARSRSSSAMPSSPSSG